MGKYVIGAAIAAIVVIGVGHRLLAQDTSDGKIGRYQLIVHPNGMTFLLDSATGRVWSYVSAQNWIDEETPPKTKPKKSDRAESKQASSLKLPEKSVEMTVIQREERAIPGSEGTVRLRLGDVTDGQAFLEVITSDGTLLPRKSIRQGDSVEFTLGKRKFTVRVVEIRNILIGDDFAKLTIEESAASEPAPTTTDPPAKKRPKKKKPVVEAGDL